MGERGYALTFDAVLALAAVISLTSLFLITDNSQPAAAQFSHLTALGHDWLVLKHAMGQTATLPGITITESQPTDARLALRAVAYIYPDACEGHLNSTSECLTKQDLELVNASHYAWVKQ